MTSSSAMMPLTDTQRGALDVMMDLLLPASSDGRMPAARTLGLYDALRSMLATDRALFEEGLATLEVLAGDVHGVGFAQLDPAQAAALVDRLRTERPAFIQSFVAQTVGRYLAHPVVMPLIGLEPRPLWPMGNTVAEGDWTLLDPVKQRAKFYRKV